MHVGVFQALPGRSMDLPPGASAGLQNPSTNMVLNEKCARRVPPKPRTWARLKFHAGWSGWTRPPTMAGGGVGQADTCLQGGVSRGGF